MDNQCLIVSGKYHKDGYSRFSFKGRLELAHRVMYAVWRGLRMSDIKDKVVRHTCDNPPCVHPDHLVVGTQADNVRDMLDRGRGVQPKGSEHGMSKLTEAKVRLIRAEYNGKHGQKTQLARKYGVNVSQIANVVNRITWRHV